jgi:hypothetical protein
MVVGKYVRHNYLLKHERQKLYMAKAEQPTGGETLVAISRYA